MMGLLGSLEYVIVYIDNIDNSEGGRKWSWSHEKDQGSVGMNRKEEIPSKLAQVFLYAEEPQMFGLLVGHRQT